MTSESDAYLLSAAAVPTGAVDRPILALLDLIKGKYKAAMLLFLHGRSRRFSEVHRHLEGASERIVARQLRELEAAGLVARRVFPEVPPRVEYSLTDYGTTLCPVLKQMWKWGRRHLDESSHAAA